ncbi:MAG: SDR family oxidoreductase, partial [Blastocatellia bacterium]|nr:SDR family oxidoreductase [Blastocatellia bacterium]
MARTGKRVALITGATGFIGRRFVKKLLEQKNFELHLLVRRSSFWKVEKLISDLTADFPNAAERIKPVEGDILIDGLVKNDKEKDALQKKVQDIYHLAAIYELGVSKEKAINANVRGTLRVLDFARGCAKLHCVHYVSTLAVAGNYKGIWTEEMLIEGQEFDNHYAYTKFLAEVEVRSVV